MNNDVMRGIHAYLDGVASHTEHLSAEDRRDLLENLECHIREELSGRISGEATVADLEAVLAEMDPPECYANRDAFIPPRKRPSVSTGNHKQKHHSISVTAGDVWRNIARHVIIPIGIMAFLVYVIPKFIQFFADLEVALPSSIQLVFSLSGFFKQHGWLFFLIMGPMLLLDTLVFLGLARYGGKGSARIWTWTIVVLQFAFFILLAAAVFLPSISLMHSL